MFYDKKQITAYDSSSFHWVLTSLQSMGWANRMLPLLQFLQAHPMNTVKPVLETTCIKQSTALRDHCSDKTPLLISTT